MAGLEHACQLFQEQNIPLLNKYQESKPQTSTFKADALLSKVTITVMNYGFKP